MCDLPLVVFRRSTMLARILLFVGISISLSADLSGAEAAGTCAPGARCLSVQTNGAPAPGPGPMIAQCSGSFPDYVTSIDMQPSAAPWFKLSQAYPNMLPVKD